MKPKNSPWGGGNQAVEQLITYFKAKGIKITHALEEDVDYILMIDPRKSETTQFLPSDILEFKRQHPNVRCIHRINECDKRKNSGFMDELLKEANQAADITVFISQWLQEYFIQRWFNPVKLHCVIPNGADSKTFYPDLNSSFFIPPLKIVTHHWSANWMKGFKIYQQVDEMISERELEGFELTVIGRWPHEIKWKSAKTFPACHGKELADLLRQNNLYLTASLWEPCGMHHIEGAQCGLPLVYHEDGGGIVEFGQKYGIPFRKDVKQALLQARDIYNELRKKVLEQMPSGNLMCQLYERLLNKK